MVTILRTVASGSTSVFSVSFPYLDKSHVQVSLNDVLLSPTEYTWLTAGQINITAGNPAAGTLVTRERVTPTTPIVNFRPGNLDVTDLNVASLQPLFIAEEARDRTADLKDRGWVTAGYALGGTLTKGPEGSVPKFNAVGDLVVGPDGGQIAEAEGYAEAAEAAKDAAEAAAFRKSLVSFGAVGNGGSGAPTDDTAAVVLALAAGVPLTGAGRTYAVSGKINLPANTSLWDCKFKQLAPGASLNVVTLEGNGVAGLDLRRVVVNRNGDGTNGGLLNGSGTNGALNSAFGMAFIGCSDSHFEDLEVYGDDSGTGILFRQIGESSKIINPYVHDIKWSRAAATDDQVQGIWFDQCTRVAVFNPRVISLTGVLNGSFSRRFTRGIVMGGCTAVTLMCPYVETADQGVDVTGGPTPNREIVLESPVVKDIWVWGVKLANTARQVVVRSGRAYDCGVSFVASPNPSLAPDVTTDRCEFIDCISINAGSNGQSVVSVAGFRVLQQATTLQGRAANIRFVRCKAIDLQTVKTMLHGFSSEITDIAVAPILEDCESIGHITAVSTGLFRKFVGVVGTVGQSSGVQTGAIVETGGSAIGTGKYTKFADGTMIIRAILNETAAAWSTASGSLFVRSSLLAFNWPVAFVGDLPVVTANISRGDNALCGGVNVRDAGITSTNLLPWANQSVGAGNAKDIHVTAVGRWY